MSLMTVLGASGFVGSHVVQKLKLLQFDYYCPTREEDIRNKQLGNVIYCIGLTADFRQRPFDTVDAHVCKLLQVLRDCDFDSLLYLSSTRLYDMQSPGDEESVLKLKPQDAGHLYNISKAMGESLALAYGSKVKIARLSNVYGPDFTSDNFLSSIVRDAVTKKRVTLQTSLESEKDYVSIDDVGDLLVRIASAGREAVYNLASGLNVSNRTLVEKLATLTGCEVTVARDAQQVIFPPIDIERIRREFNFQPLRLIDQLDKLVETYRDEQEAGI